MPIYDVNIQDGPFVIRRAVRAENKTEARKIQISRGTRREKILKITKRHGRLDKWLGVPCNSG
jgi:hypothetical protein